MDKKSFILNSIIEEYLLCTEPVSSKQLMDSIEIKISSATIRNYFNKLSIEGSLSKLHVSSGRVPTTSALQEYWKSKIDVLKTYNFYNIDDINRRSEDLSIFYILEFNENNIFIELKNIDNRYLLLIFSEFEIVIKYSSNYNKFLEEFIGYEINDLINIAKSLGILELANEIENYKQYKSLLYGGMNELSNMSSNNQFLNSAINGNLLNNLEDGFYFENIVNQGYMGIKSNIRIADKSAKIFLGGAINRDFISFLAS